MPRIQLLDERLIGKIAAGEVVERPASVVKELLENALDAGAGEVTVELEGGGKRRIVVSDDGSGMGADDALLAFDRHATSKIAAFDDLEKVATLGFRGEALATIAAVSRVEMRTAETPGDGTRVRIEGGRVKGVEPVAHPKGTRLDVESLFWNVPARRKFLKQPETELRRALEVVHGYALARPEVRFTVRHEERTLLDALPAGEPDADAGGRPEAALRERLAQVFGGETADALVAVPEASWVGRALARGFVGTPASARGRRHFVYVNRRLVRDRAVVAAFYRAVRETWRSEDFPSLFLFVELPPEEVDVNVHPQKTEVRFRDPRLVDGLGEVLRRTLDLARGEEAAPLRAPLALPRVAPAWEGLGGSWATTGKSATRPRPTEPAASWTPVARGPQPGEIAEPPSLPWDAEPAPPAEAIARPHLAPLPERAPVPLSGRSGEARPFRLLGQYKGTLLLLEGPDGLYLVDQHVAHERILYERLRRALQAEAPRSQTLLHPPILELGASEAMRLEELAPALEACGFTVQSMGGTSVALTAAPAVLDLDEAAALVRELATSDGEPEVEGPALRRRLLDALAASLACRAAIKMHHPLPAPAMEALVSELFRAENPYACPHGRPTILQMTDAELERRFGRR